MEKYSSQRRYIVNGNLAESLPEQEPRQKNRKTTRVLPRHAVDTIPFIYLLVVAMACVCILGCSVTYIHTKNAITVYAKQISAKTTELEEQKEKNDDLQNEIATSTDTNTIKKKAKELGMREAGKGEIIYYDQSDSEYVRQKEDIPNGN